MIFTEQINADLKQGGSMTGEEWYPMLGTFYSVEIGNYLVPQIMRKFKGLPLTGGCVKKAQIVNEYAKIKQVAGAVRVMNKACDAMYGHDYNPPFEMHSWLVNPSGDILDFALAGLILRGLTECDEHGPFLLGRKPIVLAGRCPDWIKYIPKVEVKYR